MSPVTIRVLLCVALLCPSAVRGEGHPDLRLLPPIDDPAALPTKSDLGAIAGSPDASGDTPVEVQAVSDPLPVVEDVASWYDWVVPSSWRLPEVWESSFELGVDGSEGNSTTLTFRTGANLHRKVDWSELKIALNYVKSTAEYVETKHNAQLSVNHDWLLGQSPWSLFGKGILVYDEFRPFDLELTLNTGVGYRFVKNETTTFKGRFGSGATRQWAGPDENWRPEAMLGVDFEHKFSDRQKLRATSEYFPQWDDFEAYRIRTDVGWELLLDEATNMSLKLGLIDRYDSQAGGLKPNALDYSLLLLWKL